MSDQEKEIRIHHYKRANVGSGEHELITEIVVEGSETGQFLKKMEETRLTRPCFQTLDMRGKVLGECKRFMFNDRVHYLDDISYALFQKGLADYNGVYTIGTFESIIFGAHTIDAMRKAQEAEEQGKKTQQDRRQQQYEQDTRPAADGDATPAAPVSFYNPEVLPFGYYRQRQEGRLQYATGVMLTGKAGAVKATTRDLSVGGAQVVVKGPCPFDRDQELSAHFTGLEAQAGGAEVKDVRYRVACVERKETESSVGLCRLDRDKPSGFSKMVEGLVERFQRKYKLDVEDDYLSAMAQFYERVYTESMVQIPFFVNQQDGVPYLHALALSDGNQPMMQFFSTEMDSYDFRPLQLRQRLDALRERGSLLLLLYRDKFGDDHYQIHSAADSDYDNDEDFYRLVQHALSFQEHMMVRVQVEHGEAHTLDERKTDYFLERLSYKSAEDSRNLRASLADLLCCGVLVDVTQVLREAMKMLARRGPLLDLKGLYCWVGGQRKELIDAKASGAAAALGPDVEIVRFGYVERRREDRYLVETSVQVAMGKRQLTGTTRDISTRGMCVNLPERCEVEVGQELSIGLVGLQKKKSATNLMDIRYRVVKNQSLKGGTRLMMERVIGRSQEGLSKFFVELIAKNRQKLSIDVGDIWSATASRIYEGLYAMNNGTLPFFIGRNEAGVTVVQCVAVPRSSNRLAEFFQGPDGEFELYPIGDPRLVMALGDGITEIHRQSGQEGSRAPHCELEIYFYKEDDPDTGDWILRWSSELEFSSDAAREAFIQKAMGFEAYRFVKIVASFTLELPAKQLEKLLEPIRTHSKHRAIKLSEQLRSLVGFGELVDITDDIARARSAALATAPADEGGVEP